MKKNYTTAIIIVLCILLASNIFQLYQLKNELYSVRQAIDYQATDTSNRISNIYQHVNELVTKRLEEKNNLLTIAKWQYGTVNIANQTIEVICTIVPKSYTPNMTQVKINYNGQLLPLSYEQNKYMIKINLPLFSDNYIEQVILDDNGSMHTQLLDWYIFPTQDVLLRLDTNSTGSSSAKPGKLETTWSVKKCYNISLEQQGEFQLRAIELVEILDDVEINRISIDISPAGQQTYADLAKGNNLAIPEYQFRTETLTNDDNTYSDNAYFLYSNKQTYHIPNGSLLELYIDVTDENGFHYRSLVDYYATATDGSRDAARMEQLSDQQYFTTEIFDETGTLLYTLES